MPRTLVCTLFLLAAPMFGQQQQDQAPAASNAQVSSENTVQTDQSGQPLQAKAAGNERIQNNLQSVFDDDPTLSGADVSATVDDQNITLTGTVQSYLQHQRTLALVSPYYSYRKIVDKVTVE